MKDQKTPQYGDFGSAPRILAEMVADSYVVQCRPLRCLHCASVKRQTLETFMVSKHPTAVANYRHRVPVHALRYNLPVHIETLAARTVPFCDECYDTIDTSTLPVHSSHTEIARKAAEREQRLAESQAEGKRRAPAKPVTIDDII